MSGPWGQDELDRVVAVVIEDDGRGGQAWRPIDVELAAAINAGQIAAFNLFVSLGARERGLMARLYAGVASRH